MTKNPERFKHYLHDLSYLIKDSIDRIEIMFEDKEWAMAASLAYYDIITIMKQATAAYQIEESEIALDIIDEDELLKRSKKNIDQ